MIWFETASTGHSLSHVGNATPKVHRDAMACRNHTHSPTKEEHNTAVDAAAKAAHHAPVEHSRSNSDPEGRHSHS